MIEFIEELLPPWATGLYTGVLKPGVQLCTRDGRRTGNAVVTHSYLWPMWHPGEGPVEELMHFVVTDAGNEFELSQQEVEELFHEPKYVMDYKTHMGYERSVKAQTLTTGVR